MALFIIYKIYLNYPNDVCAALSSSALFIFFHRTPKNTAAIATTPTYSTILRPVIYIQP